VYGRLLLLVLLAVCCHQVPGLEAEGRLLDVQKLLLTATLATQDADTICTVSRCLQSAAQELRCLQVGTASSWF
jgi:hypothetical protein